MSWASSTMAAFWNELGVEAQARYNQLTHSYLIQDAETPARKIGREADRVRGELKILW
jgi:hypothetical protein